MPDDRRIRGDVNIILNRLIREGVIAGFVTTFDSKDPRTRRVRIAVTVDSATDPDAAASRIEGQSHLEARQAPPERREEG